MAGAAFGEIGADRQSAKRCNFQYKMRCRGGKTKLGEPAGPVLQFHARIMVGTSRALQMTLQPFSANFS